MADNTRQTMVAKSGMDALIAAEQNRRKVFSGFEGLSGNPSGAPAPMGQQQAPPDGMIQMLLQKLGLGTTPAPQPMQRPQAPPQQPQWSMDELLRRAKQIPSKF